MTPWPVPDPETLERECQEISQELGLDVIPNVTSFMAAMILSIQEINESDCHCGPCDNMRLVSQAFVSQPDWDGS